MVRGIEVNSIPARREEHLSTDGIATRFGESGSLWGVSSQAHHINGLLSEVGAVLGSRITSKYREMRKREGKEKEKLKNEIPSVGVSSNHAESVWRSDLRESSFVAASEVGSVVTGSL